MFWFLATSPEITLPEGLAPDSMFSGLMEAVGGFVVLLVGAGLILSVSVWVVRRVRRGAVAAVAAADAWRPIQKSIDRHRRQDQVRKHGGRRGGWTI